MPTIQRSSLPAIRRDRGVVFLTFLLAALGFTPVYAQNITLINIDPSTASPNTPISMTASGFTAGVPAPSVSVMLTPQGGGAPITVASAVTGTGIGRSINFFAPSSPGGVYTVTASGAGLTFINSLALTLTGPPSFTLAPNSGAQSANVLVTIVGSNTSFPSGATTANFGPGHIRRRRRCRRDRPHSRSAERNGDRVPLDKSWRKHRNAQRYGQRR